jgi:hypothetical protein
MNFKKEMIKKGRILFLTLLVFNFLCCNPPVPESTLRFDFLQNFDKVVKQPSADKVFKYQNWQKATEGRDAMVIGVFGQASFALHPEQTGDDLYFGMRLRIPDSSRAECIIVVETSAHSDTVFRRSMDAVQNISDRNWSDEYVSMSKFKNQAITVRFSVQYVGTDAWVEWSSPILISEIK